MKKFPFLRRPVRLILYAVLLALVTTAALIFAWQYKLDGIVLDHAIDTYAYLGTVVRTDGEIMVEYKDWEMEEEIPVLGGPAFLEEIPEEMVQWLYESEHVARIDNRRTLAGMLGQYHRMKADTTGQTAKASGASFTQYWFLEGTVAISNIWDPEWDPDIAIDTYQVKVDRIWNDPNVSTKQMVVDIYRTAQETPLEVGQRIFLLGSYITGESGIPMEGKTIVETTAFTRLTMGRYENNELSTAQQNPYIIIPDGVDSEQYIQDFLESTGLDDILERQVKTLYTVSLRQTQDMKMIPIFAQGKGLTYEGRVLTPSDMGQKVCVIPYGIAQRNRLSVGDTIQLAAADGCYAVRVEPFTGRETGDPNADDVLLEYGEYEEYEIVGIYSQKGIDSGNNLYFSQSDIFVPAKEADNRESNNLYFSQADIFIPAEPDTVAETVRPYAFSFRIPGPDYLDFQAAFQPVLDEYGYSLIVEDTGWDDVKETFYTMQSRRQLMLLCAAAAFAAAVLVFAVLLNAHCRYEYGLRRLLGATKREAVGIFGSTFGFTALPGAAAAVLAAWYIAAHPIKDALASDAMIPLPTDGQCALTLAIWAALELIAILVVLLGLSLRGERRGLLRLIRR